jgi:hypothetical protein
MFEYKDYPKVPQHLVDAIMAQVANRQHDEQFFEVSAKINAEIEKAYGTLVSVERKDGLARMGMFVNDEVTKWVTDNVTDTMDSVHIQYFEDGTYFFPHIDLLRSKALNYVFQTADAETVFYQPKADCEFDVNTVISYDTITEVQRIKIEQERWHQLAVDKIHSVENINGIRIAITVSWV